MKTLDRKVVLSFMAHPDDAEFLCVGTLIRLAEQGWEVHIATATPGDCGTMTEDRWAISARRTGEAARAAALIGAQYHCIDERDGMVVYDKESLRKTVELFRSVAPTLVFANSLRDYMMDHEMSSLLVRGASFIYSCPNITPSPLVPGSRIPYLYYADPVDARDALGNLIEPTTVIDIGGQLEKKAEMLACHASQRDWLMAHHGNDEYIDSMRRHAAMRGAQVGVKAAEAFVQHLGHAYPHDDLLAELFGNLHR
jgi:LmbE family N-acetylglucosaminyl deacetylase